MENLFGNKPVDQIDQDEKAASLHPEGLWDATVIGARATKTKDETKDMIVLDWKTSKGQVRSWHAYVEKYPNLFLKPVRALGISGKFLDEAKSFDEIALECLKRRALLSIEHGEYQGNPTASVKRVEELPENDIVA